MNLNLIFDILILILTSLGSLAFIILIVSIFIRIRPFASNVALILTCNTCVAGLMCCIGLLVMYAYTLYGDLYSTDTLENDWCLIRAYLLDVVACALYHSYVLQAIFRFCRIVFYQKKKLQSLGVSCIAIIIQWLLAFLFILPNFLLHDFVYLPSEYHCQVPLTNFRALLMMGSIVYFIPIGVVSLMHIYLIQFIRQSSQRLQNRQRQNKRDFIVIKRILSLLMIFAIMCFPSVLLWLINIITHDLPPMSHDIEWLTISICMSIVPVAIVLITPQINRMFKTNRTQVHTIATVRIGQHEMTDRIRPLAEHRL
ncbi:unnamed protein product [Adineta steineri]|uniref:G-protein coupled receptors family 1 profile domain-containing protein n=1 Tax=Adineta steineri TaxID=433720 RepID=A0A815PRN5_9BILA|nr:unnamed protein product [Adineta steineri]CAF1630981.1 unnamed protein product [Adineta steineri]